MGYMSAPSKKAHQLNYDQLIGLVEVFQYILWWDDDLQCWNSEKTQHKLMLDAVAKLLENAGLRPQ